MSHRSAEALGLTAEQAGLAVSPLALSAFAVAGFGGKRLSRFAPQWPLTIGLALIGGGTLTLTVVGGRSTWTALVPGLLIVGAGVGMVTPVMTSAALSAVPDHLAGLAGGALNTFRQLGYALGIAVLGTVFTSAASSSAHPGAAMRETVATNLDHVFAAAGGAGLVAAAVVFGLVRRSANKAG